MTIRLGFVFLAFLANGMAQEKVPVCRLGSDYAVDLNRKLALGEEIIAAAGGIATVAQREKPGSTHIVFRRCVLPKDTEVVVGGPTPWVKVCGNALIQTEGWTLPLAASQKPQVGPQGPAGPQGEPGPQGPATRAEERPVNVQVNVNVENRVPERTEIKKKSKWKKILVGGLIVGGAVVGGYFGARAGGENKPSQPAAFKDPVVIIRTGP